MSNYINAKIQGSAVVLQIYLDDKPTSWIEFDAPQLENFIGILQEISAKLEPEPCVRFPAWVAAGARFRDPIHDWEVRGFVDGRVVMRTWDEMQEIFRYVIEAPVWFASPNCITRDDEKSPRKGSAGI